MNYQKKTLIAKNFLSGVNKNKILTTLDNINFDSRERIIINMILDKKTIKEISIELNLSLSYIAYLKQEIYRKISIYLAEENKN